MRNLTISEINKILNKYPQAKRIAVENFLSTVANCKLELNALNNLEMDAKLYNWNKQTIRAIRAGIKLSLES